MLIQKAFKYRLRMDSETESQLRRIAGSCRFVWNQALALQQARFAAGEKKLGYASLCKELTVWKQQPETSFLCEAPIHVLQQTLKDLDRAYQNFFAHRAALPVFKKRGQHDSFRSPDCFMVDAANGRVKLPKLGWVRYHNSRMVTGTPKNVTVSLHSGHWYVSVQVEQNVPEPLHPSATSIGIDRGINALAALSDGSLLQPINAFARAKRKLARLQRQLSRKVKFSENWKKQKQRITRLHTKIANMRKDYLHKLTTAISKNHAVVVIEDLQVKNMSASAKGSIEAPGKNVKQKAGLNRSILDQSWHELGRQLEYKLRWLGGKLVKVPPQYTSQTCNECGHVSKGNRKGIVFHCQACGHEAHADVNAAKNILAAGLAVIACGEHLDVTGSMKQEPPGGDYAFA
jgi:putative transposase